MKTNSDTFEKYLETALGNAGSDKVRQAMAYALLNGGKRIRPRLLWSIANNYGAELSESLAAAATIEMIHTYSLIHDDLPALDNDDLRRGKASCHKAYDEATAILAGDALLTLAFRQIAELSNEHSKKVLEVISDAAGCRGMIAGQSKDLSNKAKHWLDYEGLATSKTGCLLAAALQTGAIIANHEENCDKLQEIGENLGLAYQIQDDLLEISGDSTLIGKSLSDVRNGKVTAVTLLGEKEAKKMFNQIYHELIYDIETLPRQFPMLKELVAELLKREY